MGTNIVIMQQVTLGCRAAYSGVIADDGDPIVEDGVYIGPGAKLLGKITIGCWSIIGANAIVTRDVPSHSVVVGYNKILSARTTDIKVVW